MKIRMAYEVLEGIHRFGPIHREPWHDDMDHDERWKIVEKNRASMQETRGRLLTLVAAQNALGSIQGDPAAAQGALAVRATILKAYHLPADTEIPSDVDAGAWVATVVRGNPLDWRPPKRADDSPRKNWTG